MELFVCPNCSLDEPLAKVKMDRRLVDHLVNSSLVSRAAMQRMILRATKNKTSVVEQLLEDDKLDELAIARELASYFGFDTVDPSTFSVNDTALKFISKSMANKHGVLPFAVNESSDRVTVAVYNPEASKSVVDSLKTATGQEPTVQVAPRRWLEEAIRHFYFGEVWAAAPAHRMATRDVGELGNDESSEIVLDEVIVPPAPKPKPKPKKAEPVEGEISQSPAPRRRKSLVAEETEQYSARNGRKEPEGKVDAALDDFDAFLDSATGWGNSSVGAGNRSGIPGWDDADDVKDENPFSREDDNENDGWHDPPAAGGFNLFDEQSEGGGSADLQALVDEHEGALERLRRDLQQQRDIISALVDALVEAKVVSKRDIKHRIKRK